MKRIVLISLLGLASIVAACGNQSQIVTRAQSMPLNFDAIGPDHYSEATSTRSSFDLLSLN